MKKAAYYVSGSLLVVVFIFGWAVYSRYIPEPPDLELIVGDRSFKVKPVTYSLEKWGRAAAADTNYDPAENVKGDLPIPVLTSDKIELHFENAPDSVMYYIWDIHTGKLVNKGQKGFSSKLAESKVAAGDYAIEIRAKWDNGYVFYNARLAIDPVEYWKK